MHFHPLRFGWSWLCAFSALAACSPAGPGADKPLALVLGEAASPAEAGRRAARLAESQPALDGAGALSVRDADGLVRHLLVSRGYAEPEAVVHLRARLTKGKPRRLELLDIRKQTVLEADQIPDNSPPEEAAPLERAARLLPGPGEDELDSFVILAAPDGKPGPPPRPGGRAGRRDFALGFGHQGFAATAEAVYRSSAAGGGRMLVFVGWLGAGQDGPAALRRVHDWLQAFVWPEPPPEEPKPAPRPARRRHRRRRPEPPPPPPPPPEPREPPPPVQGAMPWGLTAVQATERVGFRPYQPEPPPARRHRRGRRPPVHRIQPPPLYTAWMAASPGKQAVVLVLFDDGALAHRLLVPDGLDESSGLANSGWLNALWAALPEVTLEAERLEYLGLERLGDWLPAGLRKSAWARPLAGLPVLQAGYRSRPDGKTRWQMSWVMTADPASAGRLYQEGLLAPRQAMLQQVLKAKRAVRYEVGMVMREAGDVTDAWHLTGAGHGRLQELFFRRGRQVWMIRSAVEARGGLSASGLLGRVEMLRLWDQPLPQSN